MRSLRFLLPGLVSLAFLPLCSPRALMASEETSQQARKFLQDHTEKLRPLEIQAGLAWWEANTTGKEEAFARKVEIQNKIDKILANKESFAAVKKLKDNAGQIEDPIVRRGIEVVYRYYLEKQVDEELLQKIVALSNAVEKNFNVFRAKVDDKELTENDVRKVLKESTDPVRREAVWKASKEVGRIIENDLKQLVQLRNETARKVGFKNFHVLQLYLNEQDGEQLLKLFDELDELTREPFREAKKTIDEKLAGDFNIKPDLLRPWHFHDPFFQETPAVFKADLDQPYRNADLLALSRDFYAGIGLPIERVIASSSLYEKPGKSPHAFCIDIDREGDVRVLANIVNNLYWMSTMLHEFGHSVYSTNTNNIPASLPYLLRTESHILTTEGVAMQFERLSKRRAWVEKMGLKLDNAEEWEQAGARALRYQLLIFSRWCQVMLRFEKAMYENPDQDLNKLWWDLVEKYQMVHRPPDRDAPDYASKIHIVSAPVYYHNYMMGELFASQVHHAIARDLYDGADPATVIYIGDKKVGDFMRKRVFEPGKTLSWNELTKHATGETLNAKAFATDFKSK